MRRGICKLNYKNREDHKKMKKMDQRQPKYFQLMTDLKEKMSKGEILPGDKLPSENELSAAYQISRQTVRKALSILENEGYIYAVHGKGTFCKELVTHSGSSRNIAVVTTYLSDYIFPRVIQGIDEVLTREGYSIILKNTKNSRSREALCLEELLQKDIEGIIIEPSKSHIYCRHTELYKRFEDHDIPYVFIQGCFDQLKDKPKVLIDDCKGGYLITKYLLDTGHRNIAGVFKSDDMQGQNRHRGYVKALHEAGIAYDPEKVIWFYTEDRKVHPYEGVIKLIREQPEIDGIVCYNDQIAIPVIQALQTSGKHVPEDISVTGFDHSYMAAGEGLQLTTIVHPQEKLGEMAAELLLSLIRHEETPENGQILIEPELVIGNSCRNRIVD